MENKRKIENNAGFLFYFQTFIFHNMTNDLRLFYQDKNREYYLHTFKLKT